MTSTDFRPNHILALLTSHGVDFVVIGGVAAILHGSARNTYDLGICFARDEGNLRMLGKALVELEARLRGITDDVPFMPDGDALKRIESLTLETSAGDFDILARPDGAPPYDRLRRNAERYDLGSFAVLVASIEDLVAMKQAAGRDKDLADIAELTAIARLRAQDGG
jgi:hypothetical protein